MPLSAIPSSLFFDCGFPIHDLDGNIMFGIDDVAALFRHIEEEFRFTGFRGELVESPIPYPETITFLHLDGFAPHEMPGEAVLLCSPARYLFQEKKGKGRGFPERAQFQGTGSRGKVVDGNQFMVGGMGMHLFRPSGTLLILFRHRIFRFLRGTAPEGQDNGQQGYGDGKNYPVRYGIPLLRKSFLSFLNIAERKKDNNEKNSKSCLPACRKSAAVTGRPDSIHKVHG
jgi:hypothetical protein